MKFLYVDVDNRKVVGLFRNSNEEIIKLNMKELQILVQKEQYVLNSSILSGTVSKSKSSLVRKAFLVIKSIYCLIPAHAGIFFASHP